MRRTRRPRFVCIYSITCTKNGRIYIGSSKNVTSRWNSHIWDMENYKHSIPEMIVDWHKYGCQSFSFSILRMVEVKDLRKIEQQYMNEVLPKKLYNKRRACAKK
jgi:group I intron endonuclease